MIRKLPIPGMGPAGPKRRRRPLRSVAMLPTLLTLGNLYFGFAAIYCCARELEDVGKNIDANQVRTLNSDFMEARAPSFLSIASWMIIASMICDALDGRVARKTGQASKFGIQLDSLADVVSFGAAPALMMITLTRRELSQWMIALARGDVSQWGHFPFGFGRFNQAAMLIGAIYLCCTALRLARFNVEATIEEAAHRGFKGLPSPGAGGAVASLVFLHDHLDIRAGYHLSAEFLARMLPLATLAVALLMVSRITYTHAVSSFFRRRPFWHLLPVMLGLLLFWMYSELTAAAVAWAFVLSGPVRWLVRRGREEEETAVPETKPVTPALLRPPDRAEHG